MVGGKGPRARQSIINWCAQSIVFALHFLARVFAHHFLAAFRTINEFKANSFCYLSFSSSFSQTNFFHLLFSLSSRTRALPTTKRRNMAGFKFYFLGFKVELRKNSDMNTQSTEEKPDQQTIASPEESTFQTAEEEKKAVAENSYMV